MGKLDPSIWNLGLSLALVTACGDESPVGADSHGGSGEEGPGDDGPGDDGPGDDGPGDDGPPTGDECRSAADCETDYSAYDYDCVNGHCESAWDYCNYYESPECGDPECDEDVGCDLGESCDDGSCVPDPIAPTCEISPTFVLTTIAVPDVAIALTFVDGVDGGPPSLAISTPGHIHGVAADGSALYDVDLAGASAGRIASADLDGDGRDDLVFATEATLGGVLLAADGPAALWSAIDIGAEWVAAGDVDGDGFADLIAPLTEVVHVMRSDGQGGWSVPLELGAGREVAVGDFDGDGEVDVAASDPGVSLWRGGATPTLLTSVDVDASGLHVGDFDGDGRSEVATVTHTLPGTDIAVVAGDGSVAEFHAITFGGILGAGDVDGDGIDDLVIVGANGAAVVRGGPRGLECQTTTIDLGPQRSDYGAVRDLDGDGRADLAMLVDGVAVLASSSR